MIFDQYYQDYLRLHQNKHCRRLHLLGTAVALAALVAVCWTPYWWLFVGTPLLVYPFAWAGHLLFERNTPATWKTPLLAARADLHMTWDILRGKIAL